MDVNVIASALWNTAHHNGLHGLELEFRVGQMMGRTFVANIGKAHFLKCEAYLKQRCETVVLVDTEETVQGDTKHVITHHQDGQPTPPPYMMTKKRMFHNELPGQPCTIRSSIAVEQRIPDVQLQGRVTKRQKRRKRYIMGPWAFDLTVVVSNADIDSEETYEVELELLDTMTLFEYTMDHIVQWGISLVSSMLAACIQNKIVTSQ